MSIWCTKRWTAAVGPRRVAAGLFGLLLAASLLSAGCAGRNPYASGSFERGVYFADNGKNLEAVGSFESFIRQNPTDSLAAEAQYRKAMTYMEMEDYPLAAVEFQIMRKDYPTSPFVEDALFAEGKAYLFQVDRVERDITGAHEARLHFLKFSQEYPGSRYMPEVVDYMQQISDLMVRKRLGQVKVYDQLKRYRAIAIVLDDVLKEEAGSTLIPQVMWERARVAERLEDPDTAAAMYESLVGQYRDGEYAERAAAALRELDVQAKTATDAAGDDS